MGKYLDIIRQAEEAQRQVNQGTPTPKEPNLSAAPVAPVLGALITWNGADGKVRTGTVDLLHTDAEGTVWAFVTTTDGWAAVNIRYAIKASYSRLFKSTM